MWYALDLAHTPPVVVIEDEDETKVRTTAQSWVDQRAITTSSMMHGAVVHGNAVGSRVVVAQGDGKTVTATPPPLPPPALRPPLPPSPPEWWPDGAAWPPPVTATAPPPADVPPKPVGWPADWPWPPAGLK